MSHFHRITLFLLLVYPTVAVDRSNFKTCDQSGFCKRQRAVKQGSSPYVVALETLEITESGLAVELHVSDQQEERLRLRLSGLEGNMVRMRVDEVKGIKPRYEIPIGDCLLQEPITTSATVERNQNGAVVRFAQNKVVLQASPFRVDIIADGDVITSINSRGLMKFEHYRLKKEKPAENPPNDAPEQNDDARLEPPMPVEADAAAIPELTDPPATTETPSKQEEPEEEPDMWEETFKTHTDSKPFGPSSVGMDFSFPGVEHVYGIPAHADSLALKTTASTDPYRLFNLDVFEYELNNPMALYGSVPFLIAHNTKRSVGVFWHNAAEAWVDIASNTADRNMLSKLVNLVSGGDEIPQVDVHWFHESGIIDVFFLLGPTSKSVFKQYALLTGTTPLPPLWSLGYHQSRWNYNDQEDVASVNNGFNDVDIPLDVIWLDIEHTNGKRYFTWDAAKFPNSVAMMQNVSAMGRKMVVIVDPHIKRDDNYGIYTEFKSNDYYVKDKNGNEYDGWCWPGSSSWPDFLNPLIREFWASKFALDQYIGTTEDLYIWNDMNEPSVFNGPEVTIHKDVKHYGGWENRDVHNIYGTYVHRASAEGLIARSNNKLRPFVLSRAYFAGTQRWGAIWTGDNTGDWDHLKSTIPMVLSASLAGISFSGADVGGFFKNPDHELLARWYQAGAYQPFFRAHAHIDTRRREPWLLSEQHRAMVRGAVRARYSLLPYWYTLFWTGERDGGPVMRPLWVEFPAERAGFTIEDEFMVGPALLVHPVTEPGATGVMVYFPGADTLWYDVDTYKAINGGQQVYINLPDMNKIPVYQRGGYIIPRRERIRRAASLTIHDPFTLIVALDSKQNSEGELYLDDYQSFEYRTGKFIHKSFRFTKNQLVSSHGSGQPNAYQTKAWLERVVVIGLEAKPTSITLQLPDSTRVPLEAKYITNIKTLVIRKPGVNIASDWTIQLN